MISYNTLIYKIAFLATITLLYSCGGGSDGGSDDGPGGPIAEKMPQATTLVFPLENSECNEGIPVSDTESEVTFEWNESEDTDSYILVLTNLNDNTTQEILSSSTTKTEAILQGVPYSWSIISRAAGTTNTAQSPIWKFYNAGEAVENYAPFPAGLVSPKMGGLATTSTSLKWDGSDIDNDIASYDVYLGTENPPTALLGSTTSKTMNTSNLIINTVYYWSVTSKDNHGNVTPSPVFEFRTQ